MNESTSRMIPPQVMVPQQNMPPKQNIALQQNMIPQQSHQRIVGPPLSYPPPINGKPLDPYQMQLNRVPPPNMVERPPQMQMPYPNNTQNRTI